jgi:hypothetical protein
MNAVGFAQRIREFLNTLFGSKLVVQLRADLEEAKRERDYFRGRLELAELRAAPQRTPVKTAGRPADWRTDKPLGAVEVKGTRKSWAQIQAENTERIRTEIAASAKKSDDKPANN